MKLKSKLLFTLTAAVVLLWTFKSQKHESTQNPTIHISILQSVQHPALDMAYRGMIDKLNASNELQGKLIIEYKTAQDSLSLAAQIAQKYVTETPQVIVGIGTSASLALASANATQKLPLIFTAVTDPISCHLVKSFHQPGGFATGVSDYLEPKEQFQAFKQILPDLKTIGIIYNPGEANSRTLLESMKAQAQDLKLIFAPANSTREVAQAAVSLVGKVDALFINNDNTALAAFDSILKVAKEQRLPLFCSDVDMVEHGALAALGPNQYQLGELTAQMIEKVLAGEPTRTMGVKHPKQGELYINESVAKELGLTIDPTLLRSAVVIP